MGTISCERGKHRGFEDMGIFINENIADSNRPAATSWTLRGERERAFYENSKEETNQGHG